MFILIFHGDLSYHKNTNILVEWWLSPLASSCILASQFLTVHHITVVGSNDVCRWCMARLPIYLCHKSS